jgi:hypothetical protein
MQCLSKILYLQPRFHNVELISVSLLFTAMNMTHDSSPTVFAENNRLYCLETLPYPSLLCVRAQKVIKSCSAPSVIITSLSITSKRLLWPVFSENISYKTVRNVFREAANCGLGWKQPTPLPGVLTLPATKDHILFQMLSICTLYWCSVYFKPRSWGEKTNRLLSFDTTRTAQRTTPPKIFLSCRKVFNELLPGNNRGVYRQTLLG